MALTQSHFRFGAVELTESTHGWLAAEDAPFYRVPGANGQFLLRGCVQADATAFANLALQLQRRHSRDGGVLSDWANVTTSSTVVRTGASAVFADGADCTKRLSGTGTFTANNDGCTADGSSGSNNNDLVSGGCTETEIGLQLEGADVQLGDLVEFRWVRVGGTLLTAYAVTPALTVAAELFPVATRQPGVLGPAEKAVPAGAAGRGFLVVTSVPQAALDDPAVTFDLRMYRQNPDTSWPTPDWGVHDEFAGCTFAGGPNQGKNGTPTAAPGFRITGDEVASKSVRFYVNNTGVAVDAGLVAVPQ